MLTTSDKWINLAKRMDSALKFGVMILYTKAIGKRERGMAEDARTTWMEIFTMEIGKKTRNMDGAHSRMLKEASTMESGTRTNGTVMA